MRPAAPLPRRQSVRAAVTIVAATPAAWMARDQLGIAWAILDDLYSEHALAESEC